MAGIEPSKLDFFFEEYFPNRIVSWNLGKTPALQNESVQKLLWLVLQSQTRSQIQRLVIYGSPTVRNPTNITFVVQYYNVRGRGQGIFLMYPSSFLLSFPFVM